MTKTIVTTTVLVAALALPVAAQAEGGEGSRQAAGGGFMSSYVADPYHDPRSRVSQRDGTGQIQGQPMVAERGNVVGRGGRWAVGR
ncbi:hypothetical protein DA075_00930 [Methylobacterium currus]|uniref:Uncharacterized protein n=1 Tax=Methylobacterium currus TaxID=2051553 RepID=A0A2R4WDQ6_9HYPH|nr:hypothetical protein [Methylobacterium currus]AWB19673.1 hypothetical protein DA075_00930 [Methylobacterium currus]UHC15622.1 hypothetical protein LRS73_24455 [Methylobacterium currus]